jgi:hypothetical protein
MNMEVQMEVGTEEGIGRGEGGPGREGGRE